MDFEYTAEQQLLRDTLTDFLTARYGLEESRAAARTGAGWQPKIWHAFAEEVGILGASLPEDFGGSGGGPVETLIIAEALGAALVVEPFVDTVVVGAGLLRRAGGELAESLLHGVVSGEVITALAALEADSGYDLHRVGTTARRVGEEWVLDGAKVVVIAAPIATHLLVTARIPGTEGLSLFVVDPGAAGITMHAYRTIDERQAAELVLDGVRLPAGALLGSEGGADDSIDTARDEAIAAIAAEAVGAMRRVLAETVGYAKQRQQFGVPIASFQALQHRMVDMHLELEQAVAAAYLVTLKLGAEPAERTRAAAAAKVTVARAARLLGQEAVQLHGAMGMTEELSVGHFFKRLTAIQYEWGTADGHTARYAVLTDPR
ncbi:acyl-CoA dehydrogenase family protein [Nocardia aurantia]|uniref:Acyl-CoA dehydrogenase fadE12 n=1 Tax=Nocardia aurantia TaxID=2585199 RepID=A0A7K0DQS7_9NOCA|nr:acyl-CoA dehydrogenase family protein [Nocardia aurantia]MQY28109.1 Acyl-CoA dehydrogenase fadE12 [Nocardia aurantia]